MGFIIGLLTFFLLLNSVLLILLVLVQLPKKDAGAGIAFGGGAADALFGAGSGNALTKITKYATIAFFALCVLIGFLQDRSHRNDASSFMNQVQQQQEQSAPMGAPTTPAPATAPTTTTAPATTPANGLLAVPATGSNAAAPAK